MVINQAKSRRKPSGAILTTSRKKRRSEKGSSPTLSKLGTHKIKEVRTVGGNEKIRIMQTETANVFDSKTKKYKKMKILSVDENPANRHYVRRNILTKGTIISTEGGLAKITSRPGQEGTVNAVLI